MVSDQFAFSWDPPAEPQPTKLARAAALRSGLQQLAERDIYIGTSSWKYPGWLGQVYDPERYEYRGKVSQKRFNERCLEEYAGIFPTVCGDFAFYQFPTEQTWAKTFEQLPQDYQFSLKIPEQITVEQYPQLPRYGTRAGQPNDHFLDSTILKSQLLERLEPYRTQLGVLVFQFGTFHNAPMNEPQQFAEQLDTLLKDLPTQDFRFAVEVRNRNFLETPDYFDCLRNNNTAHCFNSWTRMPSISDQVAMPDAFTADHTVARLLLKPGRTFQQAVEQFSPYDSLKDEYPEGRDGLRELIEHALQNLHKLLVFVNNRFEGSAIETIEATVRDFES